MEAGRKEIIEWLLIDCQGHSYHQSQTEGQHHSTTRTGANCGRFVSAGEMGISLWARTRKWLSGGREGLTGLTGLAD